VKVKPCCPAVHVRSRSTSSRRYPRNSRRWGATAAATAATAATATTAAGAAAATAATAATAAGPYRACHQLGRDRKRCALSRKHQLTVTDAASSTATALVPHTH